MSDLAFGLAFGSIIIAWTTCAWLVGKFWNSRGLNFQWGFYWSLFLSPLSGLAFALIHQRGPPKGPAQVPGSQARPQELFCSFCDTKVEATAKNCPKCGCGVFCDMPCP